MFQPQAVHRVEVEAGQEKKRRPQIWITLTFQLMELIPNRKNGSKQREPSVWRYSVLNSEQKEAFHVKEREHTLKYYYEQKLKKSQQNEGADDDKGDNLEGVQYLEVNDKKDKKAQDKEAHTKELSRER